MISRLLHIDLSEGLIWILQKQDAQQRNGPAALRSLGSGSYPWVPDGQASEHVKNRVQYCRGYVRKDLLNTWVPNTANAMV